MSFRNIAKDIKGVMATIDSFGPNAFAYPTNIAETVSNKPVYNNKDWQSSRGYAFEVRMVDPATNVSKEVEGWKEFRLQINPQDLTQDEMFAIEVTPTMRGVLVEHQGVLIKDIQISGTTGISPGRRDGGSFPDSGIPIFQVGHSGYKEFHELRTYFRTYAEAKRLEDRSKGELRMVYKNFRDMEFIYVEPQRFTMKRSSSKPFMYDYSISLKGIGIAIGSTAPKRDSLDSINDKLDKAQDYLDTAGKVLSASAAMLLRFQSDLNSTLLGPLNAVRIAALALKGGRATYLTQLGITRRTLEKLSTILQDTEAIFASGTGRQTSSYNKFTGRTSTTTDGQVSGNKIVRESTYDELKILNALSISKRALLLLLSQKNLFETSVFDRNTAVVAAYTNKFKIPEPGSVRQVVIMGGQNIQSLAARLLGSPDRYKELVILNNLKPPYISDTPSEGVLTPGQIILVPQSASSDGDTGVVLNKSYAITGEMEYAEKNLGVDLRLSLDGDFIISNTKDLDLTAGLDNMGQAISLRLALDKGSLQRYPFIGTNLTVGGKANAHGLANLRQEILSSLSSDPRIESIPFIELKQNSNATEIKIVVNLKSIAQPVPITLSVG